MPQKSLLAIPGSTIPRQVLWLAAPVLVEQSLLYLVYLSDTVLTGRYLSKSHLAAVTVSSYLLWFLASLWTLVSVGATALVARMMGAGDRGGARRICQQAMALALVVGSAMLVAGWPLAPAIVRAMNLEGTDASRAALFFRIVLLVTPMLACTAVGVACLRGAGDTRTGMWVMALVNTINITLSWSLVRGYGPLPELGFAGIAIGTACAEAVGGIAVMAVLFRGRSGLKLSLAGLVPRWADVSRILRISIPAACESLTNSLCQLWFLSLINRLGTTATAAHGVAIRCESISFLTVQAFGVAASTLTGQYLGAGRPDLAGRSARTAWGIAMAGLAVLGVVLFTEAAPMISLFVGSHQPDVLEQGVPLVRIVAFAMPALATIAVLAGALRGAGDTRWPWLFILLGYLIVRMPLTYYLTTPEEQGGAGLGLPGAWVAMLVDLFFRAGLLSARFLHGGWRWTRV
jgi:putative MATE family efflux protein